MVYSRRQGFPDRKLREWRFGVDLQRENAGQEYQTTHPSLAELSGKAEIEFDKLRRRGEIAQAARGG